MTTRTVSVPDVSCGHCKMSIESAVQALKGVVKVDVHIERKTVDVSFDESALSMDTIIEAIEDQGYTVARG